MSFDGLFSVASYLLVFYLVVLIAQAVSRYRQSLDWEDECYLDREVECPNCGYYHATFKVRKEYSIK